MDPAVISACKCYPYITRGLSPVGFLVNLSTWNPCHFSGLILKTQQSDLKMLRTTIWFLEHSFPTRYSIPRSDKNSKSWIERFFQVKKKDSQLVAPALLSLRSGRIGKVWRFGVHFRLRKWGFPAPIPLNFRRLRRAGRKQGGFLFRFKPQKSRAIQYRTEAKSTWRKCVFGAIKVYEQAAGRNLITAVIRGS